MKVQNHIQVKGKMCFLLLLKYIRAKRMPEKVRKANRNMKMGHSVSQLIYCLYS